MSQRIKRDNPSQNHLGGIRYLQGKGHIGQDSGKATSRRWRIQQHQRGNKDESYKTNVGAEKALTKYLTIEKSHGINHNKTKKRTLCVIILPILVRVFYCSFNIRWVRSNGRGLPNRIRHFLGSYHWCSWILYDRASSYLYRSLSIVFVFQILWDGESFFRLRMRTGHFEKWIL